MFRADDFPNDCVEDERDIITFPGRNIAEALREILARLGCTDVGVPSEQGEHGWHVHFRVGAKQFWRQVSRIEPETLLLFEKTPERGGVFRRGPSRESQMLTHEELLAQVRAAIGADRRFRDLSWYTQNEMDTVDWQLPVTDPAQTP